MGHIRLSDLVLRDAHQSLLATRMVTDDMLPICPKLDQVGYESLEAWGGATFDTCIRFLNEDPWTRLRKLKAALPNTPIMMLLRGQNLLGYRHYADDMVDKFIEVAARNGVDVFRIFDAVNDPRNLERAIAAAKKSGKHVQATMSYATTPVHTIKAFAELGKELEGMGADSICIKDMAGLLKPYDAYELVKELKKKVSLPVQIHSHATTGMSVATLVKAAEAGAEVLDTTISSMGMGTSHSPTETIVEIFEGTEYDTGLDVKLLVEIAAYFREVRKKYKSFESSFLGADTRILIAQVPGGMLSNLESQLKEQNHLDKMDEVLKEIPIVQKDFGYPPLVTPTSQIVGTQAVFNVLQGRYLNLTAESKDLLVGKYGKTPAKPNPEVVKTALSLLKMEKAIDHRPADDIANELGKIESDLKKELGADKVSIEDVLTYAMFPKVAPGFFKTRDSGPVKFDAAKEEKAAPAPSKLSASEAGKYTVTVNGSDYSVLVRPEGTVAIAQEVRAPQSVPAPSPAAIPSGGKLMPAPVSGTVVRYTVKAGAKLKTGDTFMIIESMKMELEIKTPYDGTVYFLVQEGARVLAQQPIAEFK